MKKGMQLQINFLIITILSLAVLILSTIITKNIIQKSSEMTTEVNQEIQKSIQKLLIESGNEIEIPFKFMEGKPVANFIIGIKNEQGDCNRYEIKAKENDPLGYDFEKNNITEGNILIPRMFRDGYKVDIKKNEIKVLQLSVNLKEAKIPGVYPINIWISCEGPSGNYTYFKVYAIKR